MDLNFNILLTPDSYKQSHIPQYPPNTVAISTYIESRGGEDESVFFGLQAYLKEYASKPITKEMVDEYAFLVGLHGLPTYREYFDIIVEEFGGYLPISIQAVREGTVMQTSNVQVQIQATDPRFYWLPGLLETSLLRAVWYPSTVATKSRKMKKIINSAIEKTSDLPADLSIFFKLHDFGARGTSSHESASLGGMAHLVNFMGTDTFEGIMAARKYYGSGVPSFMPGFSIPASEHATITSWGYAHEVDAFSNMIDQFACPGKIYACVSDSYDIYHAVEHLWGEVLKQKIIEKGGTLVIRPDSGDPTKVPVEIITILAAKFGFTVNSKGYKVLPDYIRVIQGDGINEESLPILIDNLINAGYSIDNIAFGMGGGLLQAWNRDTLKYAMKASAIKFDGSDDWVDVYKNPIHGGKTSKRGRLALIKQVDDNGKVVYNTVPEKEADNYPGGNQLIEVFRNGKLLVDWTFDQVREAAAL